jgi:hypothetical protein
MHKHISQKEHFVLLERRAGEDLSSMAIAAGRLAASYLAICLRPQATAINAHDISSRSRENQKAAVLAENLQVLKLAMSLDVTQTDRVKSSAELFLFYFGCVLKLR